MPAKCHHVHLNRSQRDALKALITSGTSPARKLTRARVLLKADTGELGPAYTDKQIQEALEVSPRTIERTRRAFALEGLDAALNPKERRGAGMPKKFERSNRSTSDRSDVFRPTGGGCAMDAASLSRKDGRVEPCFKCFS